MRFAGNLIWQYIITSYQGWSGYCICKNKLLIYLISGEFCFFQHWSISPFEKLRILLPEIKRWTNVKLKSTGSRSCPDCFHSSWMREYWQNNYIDGTAIILSSWCWTLENSPVNRALAGWHSVFMQRKLKNIVPEYLTAWLVSSSIYGRIWKRSFMDVS